MNNQKANEVVVEPKGGKDDIDILLEDMENSYSPEETPEFGGEIVNAPAPLKPKTVRKDPQRTFKRSDSFREHRFVEKGMVVHWYETGQRNIKPYSALVVEKYDSPACLALKVFDYSDNRMIYVSVDACRHIDDPTAEPDRLSSGAWCLPGYLLKLAVLLEQSDV